VSSGFIGGVCTGVAHGTGVGGLSMIKRQYEVYPSRSGGMTQLTSISGNRVGSRFISGIGPGVAGVAAIGGLSVIKRQYELDPSRSCGVAQLTAIGRQWVCGALAGSDGGVMADSTSICGLSMIKRHNQRCPHIGGMARFALFAGHRMSRGFIGPGADTIMAAGAITRLPRYC
jgi:hypothetical protein